MARRRICVCKGGTYPGAGEISRISPTWPASRIKAGINRNVHRRRPIKAVLDPYNPTGSTAHVNFNTSKLTRWETDPAPMPYQLGRPATAIGRPSFAASPRLTRASAPMSKTRTSVWKCLTAIGSETRKYLPDFIVQVDDGQATTTC